MILIFFLIILLIGMLPLLVYIVQSLRPPNSSKVPMTLDGDILQQQKMIQPSDWWNAKRLSFNRNLFFVGGISLFSLFVFNTWMLPFYRLPLPFSVLFLILFYLIYIGAANMVYSLGLTMEKIIEPEDRDSFRKKTYQYLYWSAIALPLLLTIGFILFRLLILYS